MVAHPGGLDVSAEPGAAWQPFADNSAAAHGRQAVVSPDGRRVAYWYGAGKNNDERPLELRVRDMATGTSAVVFRGDGVAGARGGGTIAWRSDGAALAFANAYSPFGMTGLVEERGSTIWLVDMRGATRSLQLADLQPDQLRLIGWDAAGQIISASLDDMVVSIHEDGRVDAQKLAVGSVVTRASSSSADQWALAADVRPCSAAAQCADLQIWRPADLASKRIFAAPTGYAYRDAVFLAGTQDLLVLLAHGDSEVRVERWSDFGNGAHRVLNTLPSGWDLAPRPDGSAVIVSSLGHYLPKAQSVYLLDPQTGQVLDLPIAAPVSSAQLVSVRLR